MQPAHGRAENSSLHNSRSLNELNEKILKTSNRANEISKRMEEAKSNLNRIQEEAQKLGEFAGKVMALSGGCLGFVVAHTVLRAPRQVVVTATLVSTAVGYLASRCFIK